MTYKPVILLGNGARHNPALIDYLCSLNIPVLTTWMAADLIPETHPAYCGRPGTIGQRAANIIQQKADQLICVGARLDNDQVGWRYDNFAPRAIKLVYDVDRAELDKLPDNTNWRKEHIDLTKKKINITREMDTWWLDWCKALYEKYQVFPEGNPEYVDPYAFTDWLSDQCQPDDVLAIGSSGMAPCSFLQAFKAKEGQRIVNTCTFGGMGADIPMAIGACIASGGRRTICVTGDGGFTQNMQELEVVRRLELSIKFFVFSNGGYGSIWNMQDGRFGGRRVGADVNSGLTLPINEHSIWVSDIDRLHTLNTYKVITELNIDPAFKLSPRVGSTLTDGVFTVDSMENMTPKLPVDELEELMRWGNE
jgi:acetolactate synthase I/II/III large subunit